jgi:site-specific recombinase XerD
MARAALVRQPAIAVVAQAAGDRLPSYVTREQARAIINVAATTTHRLLLETLWQSGGRVTEAYDFARAISISVGRSCAW